jgi:hypothetical protein
VTVGTEEVSLIEEFPGEHVGSSTSQLPLLVEELLRALILCTL